MATQKVSVTLDADRLTRARAIAGPRGLSTYLDEALEAKLEGDERRRLFLEYLDELDAVDPPTPDERERAAQRAADLLAELRR